MGRSTSRAAGLVALALAPLACTGAIADAGAPSAATDMPAPRAQEPGAAAGPPTTSGPTPGPVRPASCSAPDPSPTVARRLTRREYDATVADLLGDTTHPAQAFPAEERAFGFDNNAAALASSPLLAEQYFLAAERVAAAFLDRHATDLPAVIGCDLAKDGEDGCAQRFVALYGKRLYRRPLGADDTKTLLNVYAAGKQQSGFRTGVKLALATMLQAPRFLYRFEVGAPHKATDAVARLDGWDMATRLSYLLWGSAPDDELLAAAEQGRLATRDDVAAQVARMTGAKFSDRVRAVAASFHQQWLGLDAMDRLEKDTKVYKDWDVGVLGRLQDETARFLDDVWQNGDVTALLTAPYTFVDGALAKYYGLTQVPAAAPTQKVALDGSKRGGLLTLGGVMAMIAKANQTAPVQRGRFVRERLMCMHLPDPDRSLKIVPPALDANLTTRERFSRHATDPACAGCHAMMDPVGLGLENFDGAGKYRDTDNGKPIDASGELRELNGDGKFTGAVGLGKLLASRDEVRACVVGSWFRYGYGRVEMAGTGDDCVLQGLRKRFADGGYRLKDLLVALTDTDAFQTVRVSSLGGAP